MWTVVMKGDTLEIPSVRGFFGDYRIGARIRVRWGTLFEGLL